MSEFYEVVPMRVGQVRMDTTGMLGVIICETSDGWAIQIGDMVTQVVPPDKQELFELTTHYLGEL